jgi:hypothetical protein
MTCPVKAAGRFAFCLLALLLAIPGALAFTASPVAISPSDILNPNDPANLSCTIYAASGTAFPSYDDIQLVTELDDPVWGYTIVVNGVENIRPAERGRILTISGFELSYENKDEVLVKITLKARVPATAAQGKETTLLKIQELDARSNAIPYSVITINHLIGQPTPTPTPAFGSIAITSEPSGAAVYLDNAVRGITPVTLDGVPNGAHSLLLRLEGYQDYASEVNVMAGPKTIAAALSPRSATPTPTQPSSAGTPSGTGTPVTGTPGTLQPQPSSSTGTLSVTTSPPGAIVYIDGQKKGITPATIPGLSGGSHAILLILDGYEDFRTTTDISPGTSSEFITGLAKKKQAPGFTLAGAVAAVALVFGVFYRWNRKR